MAALLPKETPMYALAEQIRPVDQKVVHAARTAIAATERHEYPRALAMFRILYSHRSAEPPVRAMSYYGLCLAVSDNQTERGIELCRQAIKRQPNESIHYANLIQLHLKKHSRQRAVQVMEEALGMLPGDETILKVREEMGYRRGNAIPFLHRDNLFNRIFGKVRHKTGGLKLAVELDQSILEHPLARVAGLVIIFSLFFGLSFYAFYQSAYG